MVLPFLFLRITTKELDQVLFNNPKLLCQAYHRQRGQLSPFQTSSSDHKIFLNCWSPVTALQTLAEFCKTWVSDFSNLLGTMLENEDSPAAICIIHCWVQPVPSSIKWTCFCLCCTYWVGCNSGCLDQWTFAPLSQGSQTPTYSREKAISSNLPQKKVINYKACFLLPLSSSCLASYKAGKCCNPH